MDQPLYALAKQIQSTLTWPELGEGSIAVLLAGLYIEMAMLTVLGKWLEEKSWTSVTAKAGIVTSGRVEAISHKVDTLYAAAS